jgi:hypothetical protein
MGWINIYILILIRLLLWRINFLEDIRGLILFTMLEEKTC